ncbi:Thiol protease SEN102 [Apostasia shenzhenica]|uniref:Thiol protease SEN102 n=1 Tax=Apostasia shenzhenica TaxID=1088818 RepID=A0A2I0ARC7_9ASPA|nr:Thiol protease SEN102 [Apostasia shenzhenica]
MTQRSVVKSCLIALKSDLESNDCMEMSGQDLESEENLWDLYHRWQKFYMISRDHEDMLKRFNQFKETAKFVYEFNMNNYDPHVPSSCQMGLNMFSDMTDEQRSCLRGFGPTKLRRKLEETVSGGCHAESKTGEHFHITVWRAGIAQ